ncbi:hypothetical protein BKA66DRAFT_455075 [Pyrenochaeta sp. MPI-SDFR-AT-0127]|nr:hypothetical protein BKA66DRAFT_455075 [Pyrenochaeta sp. MPI-SDFR-AT-0127]
MASGLLGSASLRLPNELALVIFDQLADDKAALCATARTCRGLQHLAEERLYKSIELLSVKDLHAIIQAFKHRHERVRSVQSLKILYQYRPGDLQQSEDVRTTFNECVAHMVNLRKWHIESPFDNFNWEEAGGQEWVWGDMARFQWALEAACVQGPAEADLIAAEQKLGKSMDRKVGLALLESLTIHSHGANEDFWHLDGFDYLFQHPNLRYLHVSCITFPAEELLNLATHSKKTPLTTLIFDECELEPESLHSILRTPIRLKHLTLGENVFNVNRSRRLKPRLSMRASASLEALSAVAHSIESLTHLNPGWRLDLSPHIVRSIRPTGDGLRNFHSLKYLECDTSSFLHQAAILNRDLAPPNLDTLRLRRHWEVPSDFWDQPPEVDYYLALPSISTLELVQSSFLWFELSLPDYICQGDRLRNRHAYAYKLSKAGINLKVLIEMHRDPELIPPYLHGERVPIVHCMYDANVVGFHRHISNHIIPSEIHSSEIRGDEVHSAEDETTYGEHASVASEPTPPTEYRRLSEPRATVDATDNDVPIILSKEAPETDQLGDADVQRLTGEARRALQQLKLKFIRPRRARSASSVLSFIEDELEEDRELEFDEDDDLELDFEMEDDDFEDEDGIQIHEHNGQLYIEVYESGTDEDDDDDLD